VLEVANWLAAPAAGALMADLGADVIKVEPPAGDVFRGFILRSLGYDYDFQTNYAFQLDNRGKRSVTVSLDQPGGPELVRRLAEGCDIFLTNLVQERRVRHGLTESDLRTANNQLIYVSFSGYGTSGPDADRSGFDFAAFWAATGIMGLIGEPDAPPPLCRGGQGDHATALNILAATLAALRLRDKTGQGQHVETTLQASGMWTIAGDYSAALVSRMDPPRLSRKTPVNPIWNSYRCADGDWVLLVMPVPVPQYWPRFARMVGREDWIQTYPDLAAIRAATASSPPRSMRSSPGDRAHWAKRLDEHGLIWAPVARITESIDNPQVQEMRWIAEVEHPVHGRFQTLDTPFKIYGSDVGVRGPAPEPGQHTFDILAEFGVSEDEVSELAANGVLG
jgi:crotonobetainyl-CoA:carnitine CoA-transferase CaiB-like acyl-CoA transferase